jgi:Rps23 Pro-64 3,4-dihydroxylase Tpa1-like proline 4-hydroxylase
MPTFPATDIKVNQATHPSPALAAAATMLRLDPKLNVATLASVFARFGRIHIPGILEESSALQLHAAITGDLPWNMHYNECDSALDFPAKEFDALDEQERAKLLAPMHERARFGFQYCFDNFPIYDHYLRGEMLDLAIMRAYEFLQSPAVMEFARRITGVKDIAVVDAQATRYRPGHFLTSHDDQDEAKGRIAAYILNLTPAWRADWGGILQFHDRDGHIAEGYTPSFNALNLLRVPFLHSVSYVAPFAAAPRLSITGWFRTR